MANERETTEQVAYALSVLRTRWRPVYNAVVALLVSLAKRAPTRKR